VVICLEQGADLHMAQLMLLPLTVSCFSKIQIGFTFLVPAHLGSPGQRAVKRVCVLCVCPPLVGMAEYCDEHVCLSVWSVVLCLSVHEQISRTTCPVFTKCFMLWLVAIDVACCCSCRVDC